jgi:ABC-type multidrug transport system ATPase subunit
MFLIKQMKKNLLFQVFIVLVNKRILNNFYYLRLAKLVGYMPQELALYNDFDINETLFYFGLIYKMKLCEIKNRTQFLIEFLNLQSKNFIKNMSCGQRRRCSMAIAFLHGKNNKHQQFLK